MALALARPTPRSILFGALVGIAGLFLRAMAAGHLHKQEVLTVTGPYAYTRNPLYFGSAILTLGAPSPPIPGFQGSSCSAISLSSIPSSCAAKNRNSASTTAPHSKNTPAPSRFSSRVSRPANLPGSREGAFSFAQYKKNREYRAAIGFLLLFITLLAIWRFRSTPHYVSAESVVASGPYLAQARRQWRPSQESH